MTKRNQIVDIEKIIAAYFIVFLHFSFPGNIGRVTFSIARFAVPFFFIISGFFYYKTDKDKQKSSTKRKIKHIAILLLVSEILAFLNKTIIYYSCKHTFLYNMKSMILSSIQNYRVEKWRAISFTPLFNYSAWFLAQLIVVYLIYALLTKLSALKLSKWFALGSFIFGFLLIRICFIAKIQLPPYLDYFILFMGYPFFSFGYFLNNYKRNINKNKCTPFVLTTIILFGCIMTYYESLIFKTANLFLGSILINIALCLIFITYSDYSIKTKIGKLMCSLGNKISLYIYILHTFVGYYVIKIINKISNKMIFNYLKPLLICLITTLISIIIYQINTMIKKRIHKKKNN